MGWGGEYILWKGDVSPILIFGKGAALKGKNLLLEEKLQFSSNTFDIVKVKNLVNFRIHKSVWKIGECQRKIGEIQGISK